MSETVTKAAEPSQLLTPQFIIASVSMLIVAATAAVVLIRGDAAAINTVLGFVFGSLGSGVVGFYFGSSQGSQAKDKVIADQKGTSP